MEKQYMCSYLKNPPKIRTSKSWNFEELVIVVDFLIITVCIHLLGFL